MSYTNPDNYDGHGMKSRFTAIEYCLAVLPEFVAAFLLNMSYWSIQREPSVDPINPDDASELVHTRRSHTGYVEDKSVPKYSP